jgi:TIR domain
MEIFISWSGDRARQLAKCIRDWLKCVIQPVHPWMSEADLGPGSRWGLELAKQLDCTNFGIVCLTRESLNSSWLLFESGELAKALTESRVCPLLFDLEPRDLPAPLAQFSAVQSNEQGIYQLVRTINRHLEAKDGIDLRLDDELLHRTFVKWWPELENALRSLPLAPTVPALVAADNNMGVEFVYERRGPALEKFAEYIEEELTKSEHDEESGIFVVGTSMRAFLVTSERSFDGKDIIRRALERRCPLRLLLTEPETGDRRARQEGRRVGDIPNDIRQSVRDLCQSGVPREFLKYYEGSPTVFGIATSMQMLLNPYPLEEESHRCFTMIVRRTESRKDIYHQYRRCHFDKPWEHGVSIPDSDWMHLQVA